MLLIPEMVYDVLMGSQDPEKTYVLPARLKLQHSPVIFAVLSGQLVWETKSELYVKLVIPPIAPNITQQINIHKPQQRQVQQSHTPLRGHFLADSWWYACIPISILE